MKNESVLIGMSGGVDSSVTAHLLKEAGYSCIGCTMKLYSNEDAAVEASRSCCSLDDIDDARRVAYKLGIPHYVFNFTDDFRALVIGRFVESYLNGITTNPCIDCNRYIKFDKLYSRAKILGCGRLVTGHYARIEEHDGSFLLKKALDETKDQSYVLYTMTQQQLAHTKFPLGSLRKTEVRKLAREKGFINSDKPDSQDICFVPGGDYAAVIQAHSAVPIPTGDFVDKQGNVLGRHKGIIRYTVGQRRGLGISSCRRLYVCSVNLQNNTVVLGPDDDLYSREAELHDFNWISGKVPDAAFRCKAKIRYRHKEQPAYALALDDSKVRIIFDEPQRAITPGQVAVLYDGDIVLGGGTIVSCEA